jgi:pimeloyl-ACP methyl ester carboxylesterase
MTTHDTPTVVLVHGAFADASSYAAVIPDLLDDGLRVVVPPNPLRSLAGDSAYIASVVRQIEGPVLLVGHSYGGAVITVAGSEANVVGLVYLAGYALDEGETLDELNAHASATDLGSGLISWSYPRADGSTGTEFTVDPARFDALFAAGVDTQLTRLLAVGQRPLAAELFSERATAAAWKSKPAWGVVASSDQTINPEIERFGYSRAGMTVTEVDSSHLVMLADPKSVVDVIRAALRSVSV